jgi:hypothetical protein
MNLKDAYDAEYEPPKVATKIPCPLYKYMGVSSPMRQEGMRRILGNSEFYFPSCLQFNDPFDSNSVSLRFNSSRLKIEKYWREVCEVVPGGPGARRNEIKRMTLMSQTNEGRKRLKELFLEYRSLTGILSLSETAESMLMWSYYCEGHQGIAIRLDVDRSTLGFLFSNKLAPMKVLYSVHYPFIEYFESKDGHRMIPVFGTKADDWQHEKEWRILAFDQTGYIRLPAQAVTVVILGLRTPPHVETTIRELVSRRSPRIEIQRVTHKPDSFELEVVPA